jgi:hypothetical protein
MAKSWGDLQCKQCKQPISETLHSNLSASQISRHRKFAAIWSRDVFGKQVVSRESGWGSHSHWKEPRVSTTSCISMVLLPEMRDTEIIVCRLRMHTAYSPDPDPSFEDSVLIAIEMHSSFETTCAGQ